MSDDTSVILGMMALCTLLLIIAVRHAQHRIIVVMYEIAIKQIKAAAEEPQP